MVQTDGWVSPQMTRRLGQAGSEGRDLGSCNAVDRRIVDRWPCGWCRGQGYLIQRRGCLLAPQGLEQGRIVCPPYWGSKLSIFLLSYCGGLDLPILLPTQQVDNDEET